MCEDVRGYDERIQISREFQSQQKVFTAFIWPLSDNYSLDKIQGFLEDFVSNPKFNESKQQNQLKFKFLERIEQKQAPKEEGEKAEKVEQSPMSEFQEVSCEVIKTRLSRNLLKVKFRNSECFQEFVRSIYFKHSDLYSKLKEYE